MAAEPPGPGQAGPRTPPALRAPAPRDSALPMRGSAGGGGSPTASARAHTRHAACWAKPGLRPPPAPGPPREPPPSSGTRGTRWSPAQGAPGAASRSPRGRGVRRAQLRPGCGAGSGLRPAPRGLRPAPRPGAGSPAGGPGPGGGPASRHSGPEGPGLEALEAQDPSGKRAAHTGLPGVPRAPATFLPLHKPAGLTRPGRLHVASRSALWETESFSSRAP